MLTESREPTATTTNPGSSLKWNGSESNTRGEEELLSDTMTVVQCTIQLNPLLVFEINITL